MAARTKRARRKAGSEKKSPASGNLDISAVTRYPLSERPSKVSLRALGKPLRAGLSMRRWLEHLPDVLAARDLRALAREIARRRRSGAHFLLGMGAHPIKVGLSPLIIDLMKREVITAIAMNGACAIHDFEMARSGHTSEDVESALADGSFGMARETGTFVNLAMVEGAKRGEGAGAALGKAIARARLAHRRLSILAQAQRRNIPATIHVALGTDITHMHPEADGAAIGQTSLADFHLLVNIVAKLDGGVFLNLGSAVIIPEVFLKALNLARNLGAEVGELVTANMDFIQHYRPSVNVIERPTAGGGKGYRLTGHHEIMLPLLAAAILEELRGPEK